MQDPREHLRTDLAAERAGGPGAAFGAVARHPRRGPARPAPRCARMATMTRLVRGGLTAVACATVLAIVAAPASAGEPILHPATYPDLTTYSCRTDAIAIYPGQNINDFGLTKTCPNAEKVSGPGRRRASSPPAPTPRASSPASSRAWSRSSRAASSSPRRVWDLHLHHVVWLVHGGPTFASGEEKTIAKMPQGYGCKVGGDRELGHQLHDPQPRAPPRIAQVYITWEIDWVPETDAGADRHHARRTSAGSTSPARRRSTRSSTPSSGFDPNGDGKYVFPDEVPTDPVAPGYEERANISNAAPVDGPARRARRSSSAPATCIPGGANVDMRSPATAPTPARPPATTRPRSSSCSSSDAHYYEPAGAVSWDVAMTATPRDWRVSLKAGRPRLDQRRPTTSSKASWYESMGILPLAWVAGPTRPRREGPVRRRRRRQGDVRRGRRPHPPPAAREHRHEGPQGPRLAEPARSCRARATGAGVGHRRSAASATLHGGFTAVRGFPHRADAPAGHQARGSRSPSRTSMRFRTSRTPSRSGTASPPAGALQPAARGSATRSPTARSSSTPASSATAPARAPG